jgi:hypothetical protein
MISSFFVGIVFAVAHHVYYMRLNDALVGSAARQQWPIRYASMYLFSTSNMSKPLRFGTAFAFLVKTCFTTATGTAYVQWAWRRCRQKAVTIGAIDAAFAVDKNIFLLFRLDFLSDFPIAVVLAILLWYVLIIQT